MSARRDPRSFLAGALVLLGYSHDTAEALVQQALDAERRELAERQRDAVSAAERRGLKLSPRYVIGLIDPEVSNV